MATTLADRLLKKLKTLMPERRAKELAKGLAPTVARGTPVKGTLTGKLEARLFKLGLSERKAKELAKAIAPIARTAIKAKAKAKAIKLAEVDDELVNDLVVEVVDDSDDVELDKVAPRVNGHRLRLDLPVVPMPGIKGIEILRVMDGLTTQRTYLVAAVKGENGIVAVRQFDPDAYNVKFYPTMHYWNKTEEELASIGATSYLAREWYQRMHFSRNSLDQLLRRLSAEAKPKSRMKALKDRLLSITASPLIKAFDYLHRRVGKAA